MPSQRRAARASSTRRDCSTTSSRDTELLAMSAMLAIAGNPRPYLHIEIIIEKLP